jgi:hypothetical protein
MKSIDDFGTGNPETSVAKPALTYALIIGIVTIIFMAAVHYTHFDQTTIIYKIINWALMIGSVFLFLRHYKDKLNAGFLTIGQGTKLSALTGLLVGLITGIFMYFFMTSIAPEMMDTMNETMLMEMEKQNLSEQQMKQSLEMAKMFTSPGMIATFMVLGSIIFYTILGLIISAIIKRD